MKTNQVAILPHVFRIVDNDENKHADFATYLHQCEPLKVLELGCGVPIPSMAAYHNFRCSLITLVDNEPLERCFTRFKSINPKYCEKNLFEFYSQHINPVLKDTPKINDKHLFDKIFMDNFIEQDVPYYLQHCDELYDLIIAVNLFHLLSTEIENVLIGTKRLMSENAVLIARTESRRDFNYALYERVLQREFCQGQFIEEHDQDGLAASIFCNRQLLTSSS